MAGRRSWPVVAVTVALFAVGVANAAMTDCKIFDFSKVKCVENEQNVKAFNFFEIWALGVPERDTPELRCFVDVGRSHRGVKGTKVTLSGSLQNLVTNETWRISNQRQKSNASGRAWFYWQFTGIPPFDPVQAYVKASFKKKKAQCMRLTCYFGYTDPAAARLFLARHDRFGLWPADAGCSALRSSASSGRFDCPDGALTVDLTDSSGGFAGTDSLCSGTTLRYSWSGGGSPPVFYLTDRARGVCERPIWARAGQATYECTSPP